MAKYLCVGLTRLQYTYREDKGNVAYALQYYINVLVAVIEDRYYPGMLYNAGSKEDQSILDGKFDEEEDPMVYSTIFDINKFKSMWSEEELNTLCDQFGKCFRNPGDPDKAIFMDPTEIDDEDSKDDDSEITASRHLGYGKFVLPVPRNIHKPLVDGHLTGLSKMLDRMDKKFTGILDQSVKGGRGKWQPNTIFLFKSKIMKYYN